VDPASRTKPAGDSAEMTALRRENESLRQEQAQGQRQVDQLSKQLAADREEQRRFREMMSTNFDLLEQSVSATLAKSADKGGKGPTPPPSGPTGTASPIPGGKDPAQAAPAGSTQAGSPAASAGSHDAKAQAAKGPAAKPEAVKHEAAKPESRATVSGGKQPATAARGTAPGARSTKQGLPVAAAAMTAASAKSGAAPSGALMTADGKPYEDPDLTESANPRQLKPNRAAKPLYEKGFGLFGNRQYEQSILVYQNFLTRYPDDIYSDNAQFWIGEAYLRMDKLDEAEASYRKVLREYAHKGTLEGYKTPDAIYRIGQIYAKRNNEKLARYYLDHLARRFPDSSAGRKASHELGQDAPLTSQVAGGFSNGG
jgi:tol-pal system protein YbgF